MKTEKEKLTRDDAEEFLESKGVFNHPYVYFYLKGKSEGVELADLMVEFANQVRPFEDGDILYGAKTNECSVENISIYRDEETTYFHWNMTDDSIRHWAVSCAINSVLATDAQKQLLFDRLAKDNLKWNPETKQLEDLNEPKVGELCVFWDEGCSNHIIAILKDIIKSDNFKYKIKGDSFESAVKWDGTKEQFDRIREGGEE